MVKNFHKLLSAVREYKKPSILSLVFVIFEVLMEVFIPFSTAKLVDVINEGADVSRISSLGFKLAIIAVASLVFGIASGVNAAKASVGFARNIRHDLFKKVQSFSFSNIDKFSNSSLVTRMTTDVNNVQMAYMMLIRIAVRAPLMFIFSIVMASVMGGILTVSFLVIISFMIVVIMIIRSKAMPAFRAVFRKYDLLNDSVEENVRGIRVVKGFSREDYEKSKFNNASEEIRKEFTKAERIIAIINPAMQCSIYINMAFVLFVGSRIIVKSRATVIGIGEISAMLTYGVQILISMMMLSMVYVMLTMSEESFRRISEVLDEKPEIITPSNAITTVADGSIDFIDVDFKYSEKSEGNALSDINVHIDSGMTVGIIGGTGSGKSSFVQLIPRLYDVTSGKILVGGVDVRDYDLEVIRNNVSVVLQKNVLFSGTIKENLQWGKKDATDEEIINVCKLAQAEEFILNMPDKYETYIEQGGANLSGGQRQRLCIARALLKNPQILILDDSTSAVDTRTYAMIQKGFREYIPNITKIIIDQRISSIKDSDMIIVFDGGKISAIGKHDELILNSTIYSEIYKQQMKGGDE